MSGKKGQEFKFDFGGDSKEVSQVESKEEDNGLGALPKDIQEKVSVLKHLQDEKEKVEEQFQKELRALETKYEKLFQPFYEKREKIVSGSADPSAEELEASKEHMPQPVEGQTIEQQPETGEKGIPLFWTTALLHSEIADLITEKDEEILKHLLNITAKTIEEGPSFELVFTFAPNPFFTETVLRKAYKLSDSGNATHFEDVEPANITWAAGKSPLVRKVQKEISTGGKRGRGGRGGKHGGKRTTVSEEPCDSFFHFFDPEKTPLDIFDPNDDDDDEEGMDGPVTIEQVMEQDYEFGMLLKDEIIPNAIRYFTGEADAAMFGDSFGGEDDDDEEEGEEGEDSEDDEDFDPSTAPPAANPADCKQQ